MKSIIFSILITGLLFPVTTLSQNKDKEPPPFSFNKSDFGKIKRESNDKITSENQAVKDQYPIDLPAHYCFSFEDKRPLPAFEKGARYFSPAYSFICFIPTFDPSESTFDKAYPNFANAIRRLGLLLLARPSKFVQYDDLVDVPYNHSGWSFVAKRQYLDYENVSGVSFVTQYSQEALPNPVNNEELTFNFQGLTKSGEYYVAARFAVSHPSLPKGIDFTDKNIREGATSLQEADAINKFAEAYLEKEQMKVEALPEDSFKPSLISLKQLISSISIK